MSELWATGQCWRCDATERPVMWIGTVTSADYGHRPFYACDDCIRRLEVRMREYSHQADRA